MCKKYNADTLSAIEETERFLKNQSCAKVYNSFEEVLDEIFETDEKQASAERDDFLAYAELKINQAEAELANNKGLDAKESLKRLKEKFDLQKE